jgi:hypothetical protein
MVSIDIVFGARIFLGSGCRVSPLPRSGIGERVSVKFGIFNQRVNVDMACVRARPSFHHVQYFATATRFGRSRRGIVAQRFRVLAVEEYPDRSVEQQWGQGRPGSVGEKEEPVVPDRDRWAVASGLALALRPVLLLMKMISIAMSCFANSGAKCATSSPAGTGVTPTRSAFSAAASGRTMP